MNQIKQTNFAEILKKSKNTKFFLNQQNSNMLESYDILLRFNLQNGNFCQKMKFAPRIEMFAKN